MHMISTIPDIFLVGWSLHLDEKQSCGRTYGIDLFDYTYIKMFVYQDFSRFFKG